MEEQEDLIMTDDYYGREDSASSSSADHRMDQSPLSEVDSSSRAGRTSEDMDLSSPDDGSSHFGSGQLGDSQRGGGKEGPLPLTPLNASQCHSNGNVTLATTEAEDHFGPTIHGESIDNH